MYECMYVCIAVVVVVIVVVVIVVVFIVVVVIVVVYHCTPCWSKTVIKKTERQAWEAPPLCSFLR